MIGTGTQLEGSGGKMGYSEFVKMEFHISRQARDYFQFNQSIINMSGNVIFANFDGAQLFGCGNNR